MSHIARVVITQDNTIVRVSFPGPQGPAGAAGAGAADADATTKGILKLANDLGGTAALPTVPGLAGKEPTVTAGTTAQYYRGDKSFQTLDETAVGLGNVDNTSDVNKPISTATQTALDAKAASASTVMDGDAAGGVLSGTYPNPSFASDMATQAELDAHVDDTSAAHAASAISYAGGTGISSTDVESAIDELATEKENVVAAGTTADYWRGDKSFQTLNKTAVGLSNVDNTSDASKPVSTATQTALNGKQTLDSDLTTIAGLSPSADDFIQFKSGAWAVRTKAQVKVDVAPAPDIQVFTANGTWTKPTGATSVTATVIGAGSGGGSGRRGAAGTVRCGGGGGGSGGVSTASIPASSLTTTVTVVVGTGGTGGAAVTANDTNGNAGGNGNPSNFGTYVLAGTNTTGGSGGTNATGLGGAAGTGNLGSGAAGAAASTTGGIGGNGASQTGSPGGGSGGGITTGDVAANGGAGGRNIGANNVAAAAGVVDTTSPGAGYAQPTDSSLPGNAGGGGAASITTAAQTGGVGGIYGAPGGGGGASLNGNNSGAGGNGASGVIVITTYF